MLHKGIATKKWCNYNYIIKSLVDIFITDIYSDIYLRNSDGQPFLMLMYDSEWNCENRAFLNFWNIKLLCNSDTIISQGLFKTVLNKFIYKTRIEF